MRKINISELIKHDKLIQYYVKEKLSLRMICKKNNISLNQRIKLANYLRENGYKIQHGRQDKKEFYVGQYTKIQCPICQKLRVIKLQKAGQFIKICLSCATKKSHKDNPRIPKAENHYNWKGGINLNSQGYIQEYVRKNNKYYSMTGQRIGRFGGYVLQHRLVVAEHLNRCLQSHEIIHHINGNKTDNRIENLKLTVRGKHKVTYFDGYRDGYKDAMHINGKHWDNEREEWVK